MKNTGIVVLVIVVIVFMVILFMMNKNSNALIISILNKQDKNSAPDYATGLNLSTLIKNTKCGEDKTPCTIKELQDAGWTPGQIAAAQQGATTTQNSIECAYFGINC